MRQILNGFLQDEDGAITIDWVVLTAAVVGFQIIVLVAMIRDSLVDLSDVSAGKITQYNEFLEE